MSNQTQLTPLENALYQRELNRILELLIKPIEELRRIFKEELGDGDKFRLSNEAEVKEIQTWIESLPKLGASYFVGYYIGVEIPTNHNIPDAVKNCIAQNAIQKHLEMMDELTEIKESSYRNGGHE